MLSEIGSDMHDLLDRETQDVCAARESHCFATKTGDLVEHSVEKTTLEKTARRARRSGKAGPDEHLKPA